MFAVWYAMERTLSIHSIVTVRREAFYWLAILFTFALGTAAGDLVGREVRRSATPCPSLCSRGIIVIVAIAHFRFGLNAVLSFWLAYIMTRPLGASIGDFMSQNDPQARRHESRHDRRRATCSSASFWSWSRIYR